MEIIRKENLIIKGSNGKAILVDYQYPKVKNVKSPILILVHGYKGFKDWGCFPMIMDYFTKNGFAFLKFNFSHNGGTISQPIDFPDLESFGNNNYSKEIHDLNTIINWVFNDDDIPNSYVDKDEIYLIGHSRGGGISIICASNNSKIKKIATWSSVSDLTNRPPFNNPSIVDQWKKNGVLFTENSRTHQQMPLYYQFAEDTLINRDKLDIETACKKISIPQLIVHGTCDNTVLISEAENIQKWNPKAVKLFIEGANHVFGGKHPYTESKLPIDFEIVCKETIKFFKN